LLHVVEFAWLIDLLTAVNVTQSLHSQAAQLFAPILAAALESGGSVSPADLARARKAAAAAHERLDQALIGLGLLTELQRTELLGQLFGVEALRPEDAPGEPVLPDLLRAGYLLSVSVLPVRADAQILVLAMVDPFDDFAASALALKTGCQVRRLRIGKTEFAELFAALYGAEGAAIAMPEAEPTEATSGDIELLRDAASDAPVIRFVQESIASAVTLAASDIHLRPTRTGAEMLFRIDGELRPQPAPEGRGLASIVSRLKILANLDISERRLPQDGRIRANVAGRPVDIRLSTMPHVHGEGAVLRLLSRELAAGSLGELGFSPAIGQGLEQLFGAADGLVLVTGPTGSGKSTTLHAALKQLVRPGLNVVTIEDPVEYRVDGAAQIQVDEKLGLTFPRVLRSLLRQDPDIILVGEIRDAETARIAVQAALTGHLVLATLHTNSAPAAVPRLIDMGVEPYLLAAVLRGVLAQRLVRRAGGGRIAVGELVLLEATLTEQLASAALDPALRERLSATGYRPLIEDARQRAVRGEIDAAELRGLADV
jgi:general secretion pathway protein E